MIEIQIHPATEADVPLLLDMFKALPITSAWRRTVATEQTIRESFFGATTPRQAAIARSAARQWGTPSGFLHTHVPSRPGSTGRCLRAAGVAWQGIGTSAAASPGTDCRERGCGRMEWSVLDWNEPPSGSTEYQRRAMDEWTASTAHRRRIARLCESVMSDMRWVMPICDFGV